MNNSAQHRALIVRGGWSGHQPVEATELFIPFLIDNGYEVRIEESPEVYADAEAMGHLSHIGFREIGDVHGTRGDAAGFFRHWKTYAASKDRHDMSLRKERLVAAVARRHGWQAALAVCDDKRIGPDFRRTALQGLGVSDLEAALASLPESNSSSTANSGDRSAGRSACPQRRTQAASVVSSARPAVADLSNESTAKESG